MALRRITLEDATRLREVRLAALADSPQAFASTYEHEAARPIVEWERRTSAAAVGGDQTIILAIDDDGMSVGMVGGFRPDPESGDRQLYGLWVGQIARGTGLGAELVEAISTWAGAVGARRLNLWVTETNHSAVELYERLGFHKTGVRQLLPSDPTLIEIELVRAI